jgi:uncharacterized protein YabN with tetrapyrrole methylase and pyrophosphatase domain
MNSRQEQLQAFGRLLDIMDELRDKCPWDKKANHAKPPTLNNRGNI